jgi:F0F1-type ATP synthase epsilon subunit
MSEQFQLTITGSGGEIFSSRVSHITLPGENGFFGVYYNHMAMLALLTNGDITIHPEESGEPTVCHIDKGVVVIAGANESFGVRAIVENPSLQREKER